MSTLKSAQFDEAMLMLKAPRKLVMLTVLSFLGAATPEFAFAKSPPLNFYGVAGGIDMPSASSSEEGELSFSVTSTQNFRRMSATFQFTPRISGTFRYSYSDNFLPAGALYDRSFDLRFQLATETARRPAIVIGLQDFVGTGVLSGEYIAATKNFRGGIKATAGIGWGRLGSYNSFSNPLGIVAARFKNRSDSTRRGLSSTGNIKFGQWFRGDAAAFAGLEWQSKNEKWLLKAEYSSDDYVEETSRGIFNKKSPLNFGVEYGIGKSSSLGVYYLYGSQVALKFSSSLNVKNPLQSPQEEAPAPLYRRGRTYQSGFDLFGRIIDAQGSGRGYGGTLPPYEIETSVTGVRIARVNSPCSEPVAREIDANAGAVDLVIFDPKFSTPDCSVILRPAGDVYIDAVVQRARPVSGDFANSVNNGDALIKLTKLLKPEGISVQSVSWQGSSVEVRIFNARYDAEAQAIGRTARAMANTFPDYVEEFRITPMSSGLALSTITIQRSDLESLEFDSDGAWRSFIRADISDATPQASEDASTNLKFPKFSGGIRPYSKASLFDPDNPLRIDVGLLANARLDLGRGLSFSGEVTYRVLGNISESTRGSNSVIQRVRTDIDKYQRQGNPSLERLTADYYFKLSDTTYGRVSAGYFETMYGGLSGEILWKPVASNFAVGAELNMVKQRDFDQMLGFQNYETVTGHASLYWEMGNGFHSQLDVGRYLAKDFGATLRLDREFDNGWSAGAYMTLTDVSFEDFGEGSFDKGITLRVPFSWLSGVPQRNDYSLEIQPVLRDGGAKLRVPGRLYPTVRDYDAKNLKRTWGKFYR